MNKITEQELNELRNIVSSRKTALQDIGEIESMKHNKLHELNAIDRLFVEKKNNLSETYGNININIETGEISDAS